MKSKGIFKKVAIFCSCLLVLLQPLQVHAVWVRVFDEKVPKAVETGVGGRHYILGYDQEILPVWVRELQWDEQTGELWADVELIEGSDRYRIEDGKLVRNIQAETEAGPGGRDSGSGSRFADLTVGVGPGLMAALQYTLITDSQLIRDIESSRRAIEKLQEQLGEDWFKLQEASVRLQGSTLRLALRLEQGQSLQNLDLNQLAESLGGEKTLLTFSTPEPRADWRFLSEDKEFRQAAEEIVHKLAQANVMTEMDQRFYDISREALREADLYSWRNRQEESQFLLDMANVAADALLGIDPFTGVARSLYETLTGYNIVTGEPLSDTQRTLAALGIVTAGYALRAYRVFQLLYPVAKRVGAATLRSLESVKNFFNQTGNGFHLVGSGSEMRRIQFRPNHNSNWGLSQRHLHKHFFGPGRSALAQIDPGGNPDLWMQNFVSLAQSPVTRVTQNGALDIMGTFARSDGNGTYQMGIRLMKGNNGTYDLVTILTRQ